MSTDNNRTKKQAQALPENHEKFAFDPMEDIWKLSLDVTVRLGWMAKRLREPARSSARRVLLFYAKTYSAGHTCNMCEQLKKFADRILLKAVSRITGELIQDYKATLTPRTEWHLGALRGFFRKWRALRYPGIDPGAFEVLDSLRLRGAPKGEAVLLRCPRKGALSDMEFESLQAALLTGFEKGTVALDDFANVTLFMASGRRPRQIGDIKVIDLIEVNTSTGFSEFVLKIPRRKQRGTDWRERFRPYALTNENGLMLKSLIQWNLSRLETYCGSIPEVLVSQLPLFPNWEIIANNKTEFDQFVRSPLFHRPTEELRRRMESTIESLSVLSERTGEPLHVFPLRLRRTVGTRAAQLGYGPRVIAELLDHDDDQSARVYTENVPERVDAINEAIGTQMAPIIQAFAGVLVDDESVATRGNDPRSRIRSESGEAIGNCGHFGFCGAFAPIACYTCKFFNAWIDGDHEPVLQYLINQQFTILKTTGDQTMAHACDRSIFAVTEAIRRCEERKEELRKESK